MSGVNETVLADPVRLEAVERSRRTLPALPIPLDGIAALAARLLGTPMAAVALVGRDEEFFAGAEGLPGSLVEPRRQSLDYSVCKYVVNADHVFGSQDLLAADEADLRTHLLLRDFGVRAFLGVPIRDEHDRPVGSLTVMDVAPRQWTTQDSATLLEIERLLRPPRVLPPPSAAITGLDNVALLDSVPEAFLAVNPDGVIVGANTAAERLFGYPRDQLCGADLAEPLTMVCNGEPLGDHLQRLSSAVPALPVRTQVSVRDRAGQCVSLPASISFVNGSAGALACVFLSDPSDQQAADGRGSREHLFLTALLDSLSVGVLACDAGGRIVLMNRALREIHGLSPTDELPADYGALVEGFLFDSESRPLPWSRTPLMRTCAGEHVDVTDIRIIAAGQRTRVFAVTAQPVLDERGGSHGAVAVSHEVTALRRTEDFRSCHLDIERAFETAQSIAAAAPAVLQAVVRALGWTAAELYLIDDATGELRAVAHFHVAGTEPDGFFDHVPVKGSGVTGRVWQSSKPVWIPDISATSDLVTAFEKARVEVCLRHGVRTVLAVPVRNAGTLLGVLTCYAGATEHHEDLLTVLLDGVAAQIGVFVALRRAEELTRQLQRSQDNFITLLGHELRTPLTSVAANAAVLCEDAATFDDDTRHMIETINRNTTQLQGIVSALLELAALESGDLRLPMHDADVADVIAAAVSTARARTHAPERVIEVETSTDLVVGGDVDRLRQLLQELVINAIIYSPSETAIEIRAYREAHGVIVTVADNGIGIPSGENDHVFERFYRATNVRHQGISGTGLGLTLARAVARLHGGTIHLARKHPTGTKATVRLPIHRSRTTL